MYADQFDEIKIGSMLFYPSSLKMVTPLGGIIFTRKEIDILLFCRAS